MSKYAQKNQKQTKKYLVSTQFVNVRDAIAWEI